MFTLPGLSDIDVEIKREQGLLSGAQFLNSSGELSAIGHTEVQEEILYCINRIDAFKNLQITIQKCLDLDFPNRKPQFASQEVIDEFKRLIGNATLVLDDFKSPVQVDIVSTPQ